MEPPGEYAIRIKGHLSETLGRELWGLTVENLPSGEALLCGPLADQAALFGVLLYLHARGIALLAVNPLGAQEDGRKAEKR